MVKKKPLKKERRSAVRGRPAPVDMRWSRIGLVSFIISNKGRVLHLETKFYFIKNYTNSIALKI